MAWYVKINIAVNIDVNLYFYEFIYFMHISVLPSYVDMY